MAPAKNGGQEKTKGHSVTYKTDQRRHYQYPQTYQQSSRSMYLSNSMRSRNSPRRRQKQDNTLNKAVQAKEKRNASYLNVYGCPESSKCYFSCHLKNNSVSVNGLLIIKPCNKIFIFSMSCEIPEKTVIQEGMTLP